ncbi:MAG: FKBP-type peptidyl-prolyl cis-trans isomerase [Treponema sp.]|nr:FKBP-type peptidyl-prolyl cis-trans isomerase [Treponema sp.]
MKRILVGAFVFLSVAAFSFAQPSDTEASSAQEFSYAFGMAIATDVFLDSGFEIDYDAFMQGIHDVINGKEGRYTLEQAMEIIRAGYVASQMAQLEQSKAESLQFLVENAERPGVVTMPSGLQYEVIEQGSGEMPAPDDVVLVHYRGTTINGTVFDSTVDRGSPVQIPLDMVIPGWAEGLLLMREGEKAKLFIPSDLAYGEQGAGGVIPPHATLIFEVELISIVRDEENSPQ